MKKTIIIAVLTTGAFLALGIILFNMDKASAPLKIKEFISQSPQIGKPVPIQKAVHISNPDEHEPYNSNPPTSGPHLGSTVGWGIYNTPLLDEQVLHSLEHGGIWISYKDIDKQTKANLKAVAKANPGSVILSPRPNDDSNIALASWGRLLKLGSYDEQVILNFIRSNKNKSPEKLAF